MDNRDIRRGDIYWIDTAADNTHIQRTPRPAIVVSNDKNNTYAPVVEVVYLTKQPKKPLPTHCLITSSATTSTALCEQVNSIDKEDLGRHVGTCTEQEMEAVDRCLAISLGLQIKKEDSAPVVKDVLDELADLRVELERSRRGEELMRELYTELLAVIRE